MTIKIIPIFKRAREIKPDGADIEEVLEHYTVAEVKHIIEGLSDEQKRDNKNEEEPGRMAQKREAKNNNNGEAAACSVGDSRDGGADNTHGYPFEILGIADDGRAYFLNYKKRLISYELDTLTQNKLIGLGGLQYFKSYYPKLTREDWLTEIDAIMRLSNDLDFDVDNIRGRGAWRDRSGNISYHDGQKTQGTYDQNWTFIRKPKKDIGLSGQECGASVRANIMALAKRFSFKTPADAVRLLSWSALAPFSGALTWRVAALVTGESGSGKSTVVEKVVLPLSLSTFGDGGSSTEPGLRQYHRQDACGIVIDEAERKKKKARERLDDIFTMMRTSTSDGSPSSYKGTAGGSAMVFKMRCMFCFVAIDATIEDTANDNRIIKIDFKKVDNYKSYTEDMRDLKNLLTLENCNGIRAFTWNNLQKIIRLAKRLELIIQQQTGQDARYAAGESILLATNMIVWENIQNLDNDTITEYVAMFYENQTVEEKRDETDEMVQSLLDETIIFGNNKNSHSLRELLIAIKRHLDDNFYLKNGDHDKRDQISYIISAEEYISYKRAVEQCGLTVHGPTRELAIAHPHKWIMRILGVSQGYHRQLKRHKQVMEYNGSDYPTMTIDSGTKRAVIIGGCLDYNSPTDADAQDDRSF